MDHSTRPTLPPLHTLGLPRGGIVHPLIHEEPNRLLHVPSIQSHCHQRHQPYITPPMASQNASPPNPCLLPSTDTPASTSTTPFPTRKIRLVPTSFAYADAVVVISPPTSPNTPPPQPILLVGPALHRLRLRQRPVPEGSCLRSYRFARGPSDPGSPTEPSYTGA